MTSATNQRKADTSQIRAITGVLLAVLLTTSAVQAQQEDPSAPKLVKEGNQLLTERRFDAALSKYQAAAEVLPDAAEPSVHVYAEAGDDTTAEQRLAEWVSLAEHAVAEG